MNSLDKSFIKQLWQCAFLLSEQNNSSKIYQVQANDKLLLTQFIKIKKIFENDESSERYFKHLKKLRSLYFGIFKSYVNSDCAKSKDCYPLVDYIFIHTLEILEKLHNPEVRQLCKKVYGVEKTVDIPIGIKVDLSIIEIRKKIIRKNIKNSNNSGIVFFKNKRSSLVSFTFHVLLILALSYAIKDKLKDEPREIKVTLMDNPLKTLENEGSSPEEITEEIDVVKAIDLTRIENIPELEFEQPVVDEKRDIPIHFGNTFSKHVNSLQIKPVNSFSGRKNKSKLLEKYGGTEGGQNALLQGLRYLKSKQNPEGSWGKVNKTASTSFATLAFYAYGATHKHTEFGETIKKAVSWMLELESENKNSQISGSGYIHPVFTLSICEASALMPQSSRLKSAMERLVHTMLSGQCENGGFPYFYAEKSKSTLTLTGWNGLALKAALDSGCHVPSIYEAKYDLINYLKSNFAEFSCFHYPEDKKSGNLVHMAIGCSLLQYFKGNSSKEVKETIKAIRRSRYSNFYEMYYINLCIFNQAGNLWKHWSQAFQEKLLTLQSSEGAWVKPYWRGYNKWYLKYLDTTISTSLACMMLSVFYRYPASKDVEPVVLPKSEESLDLLIP